MKTKTMNEKTIQSKHQNSHLVVLRQHSIFHRPNLGIHSPPGSSSSEPLSRNLHPIVVERRNWRIASLHCRSPKRSFIDVVILHLPDVFFTARHSSFWAIVQCLQFLKRCSRDWITPRLHRQHVSSSDFLIRFKCGPIRAWPVFIW
jgi:hypothetical protein